MKTVWANVLRVGVLLGLLSSTPSFAKELNFYTFNIRFYGSFAPPSLVDSVHAKDSVLRNFITNNMSDADVIAFEEIVDLERFYSKIVPKDFNCHSYDHSNAGHQHVVICVKKPYKFAVVDGDDNYAFEEVAMETLRPAVYGIVTDGNGRGISYVIALHLKAMEDKSSVRLQQATMLAKRIKSFKKDLPVVLLGDFNTFNDDKERITEKLNASNQDFTHVDHSFEYTFRTLRLSSELDHYWVSSDVEVKEQPQVLGPCNLNLNNTRNRTTLSSYNGNVSDHCPLKVKLGF